MAEYIEREAVLLHIKDLPTWWADAGGVYGRSTKYPEGMFDCEDVVNSIENAPSVEVAPVVHGRWIEDHDYLKCPECGIMVKRDFTFFDIGDWNYCPNCGAKMDLEEEK
nr:hypothetical protein [uncultured Ruminococcus sp.]